jgi:hypothetical protein
MANAFSQLPKDASLDTICGEAGKVFAARKANNPQTDFNTEIWYLAGDAMSAGFSALRGMTKDQVARAMGDSISRHINAQRSYKAMVDDEYPVVEGFIYFGNIIMPGSRGFVPARGAEPPQRQRFVSANCPHCGQKESFDAGFSIGPPLFALRVHCGVNGKPYVIKGPDAMAPS